MENIERRFVFQGIMGYDCGVMEDYVGSDKRLKEKGFIVNGGIPTLRGFARISELANASYAEYKEYQRERDDKHLSEISEFLFSGKAEAKFLPEIILAVHDSSQAILKKFQHKSFSSIAQIAKGAIDNLDLYTLSVSENSLTRVDGNHRLEAGKDADYYVPFSIILWTVSDSQDDQNLIIDTENKNTESEAFLFYLLNNTAKQLKLEENYKGLVRSETWTDDELRKINSALPMLRLFYQKWLSSEIFTCPLLDECPLSQIGQVLSELIQDGETELDNDAFERIIFNTIDLLKQRNSFNYIKEKLPNVAAQLAFCVVYHSDKSAMSFR